MGNVVLGIWKCMQNLAGNLTEGNCLEDWDEYGRILVLIFRKYFSKMWILLTSF